MVTAVPYCSPTTSGTRISPTFVLGFGVGVAGGVRVGVANGVADAGVGEGVGASVGHDTTTGAGVPGWKEVSLMTLSGTASAPDLSIEARFIASAIVILPPLI